MCPAHTHTHTHTHTLPLPSLSPLPHVSIYRLGTSQLFNVMCTLTVSHATSTKTAKPQAMTQHQSGKPNQIEKKKKKKKCVGGGEEQVNRRNKMSSTTMEQVRRATRLTRRLGAEFGTPETRPRTCAVPLSPHAMERPLLLGWRISHAFQWQCDTRPVAGTQAP